MAIYKEMKDSELRQISIENLDIEVKSFGAASTNSPIIMLHDSLGSVEHWKDFPREVSRSTGHQVLVYSREGSGRSSGFRQTRGINYLHDEAQIILPAFFNKLEITKAILFGHSDGASIALIFAASFPALCEKLIVSAPHLFVETITIDGIKAADSSAREKIIAMLERYHNNASALYFAWKDIWLNPEFRGWNIEELIGNIGCPVLAIQGKQDEYGTARQVERIAELTPDAKIVLLDDCRHATYKDKSFEVLQEASAFVLGNSTTHP